MTSRRRSRWIRLIGGGLGLIVWTGAGLPPAQARDLVTDPAIALKFLDGLRERGYHDLAQEYLQALRANPQTPEDLKSILDFEEGRGLIDEARNQPDLERRRANLEQARIKLEAFVKDHADHPRAAEAMTQIASMLFERGLTAALQASETIVDDSLDAGQKAERERTRQTRLAEARASFLEARAAYDRVIEAVRPVYESYPKYLPESDPRKAERDQAHVSLMDAELQRALVDYEDAQTYPRDDPRRNELLETARTQLNGVYDRHRSQLAGFFAHMWAGKCYEEQGKLNEAMGIYKELMEHPDPALDPLKRKVAFFQLIIDGKRGDHLLAVDRAGAWLQRYPRAVRTNEGTGVRFELARNILAQLPELPANQRQEATRRAVELLTEIVRVYSPYKPEAVALLREYKPSAAIQANEIARLRYEDAYSQGETALSTNDWPRAIALFRQAIRQADPNREPEKANRARYMLSYCCYMDGRYYEAAILAEHLARHYPQGGLSAKSTEIGLAALTRTYQSVSPPERPAELNRLLDLARYAADTYAREDQGDTARLLLGEVALGQGRYADAATAFTSIREDSSRHLEGLVRAGDAHWRLAGELRNKGETTQADDQARQARELLERALAKRIEARAVGNDPGYLTNLNALAEIHRAEGRPEEAIALLKPAAEALGDGDLSADLSPLRTRLLTILLRSQISAGQADDAIAVMGTLKASAEEGTSLTQLYFELARSLKREMETLARSTEPKAATRLTQTRQAYKQFLESLVESEDGQTFDSLMFAGESLLDLGEAERAAEIFDQVLKLFGEDPAYAITSTETRLVRTRLRKAEALRLRKSFTLAQRELDQVKELGPTLIEPRLEQGYLYEAQARHERNATQAARHWKAAYAHWQELSSKLQKSRPRRIEYYEAIYQVAVALEGMGQPAKAASTLKGVMTLSPSVGSPEMKTRYEEYLQRLTRD